MRSQLFVKSLLTTRDRARSIILLICAIALVIELPRLASYFRTAEQPRASHGIVLIEPRSPADADTMKTAENPAAAAPFAEQKKPSQLPAASPATAQQTVTSLRDNRAALNLQAAQDVINRRVPAITVPPTGAGVQSEGYLPPWDALHASNSARSFASKPSGEADLAVPVAAQPVQADVRRISKKRSAYVHRRAKVPSSPFGGLFGF